jgi:hypothetical protein
VKTLLFAAGLVAACTLNAADFRNATWGMTPEQVIKSEKVKLKKNISNKNIIYLTGTCKLQNQIARVIYRFKYNKLYLASYEIKFSNKTELQSAQSCVSQLAAILKKKYGTETIKERLVYGYRYRGNHSKKPTLKDFQNYMAEYTREWHLTNKKIKLSLECDEVRYKHTGYYVSIIYEMANCKSVFKKWKQEDAKKTVSQTETQL